MDNVTIPMHLFNDRRIKLNHLRVFAVLVANMGKDHMTPRDIARDTGIDRADVYRVLSELADFGLYDEDARTVTLAKDGCNGTPVGKIPQIALPPAPPPSLRPEPQEPFPLLLPPTARETARATRLPGDWQPDAADRAYAKQIGLREIDAVAEDFRDFWHIKPGRDATKMNWPTTWKRWCRTAKKQQDEEAARAARLLPLNGKPALTELPQAEPWEQRMAAWRKSKLWNPAWGFRPGEAGCRVPPHLLDTR